jgi:UDP-2,4-diacetamido-2,4,6-trideoxy-beta-L-altropyranose hydrolase
MNNLVIRADSTTKIGVGHIMRCIALGQVWQDNGGKVVFISHCESATLKQRLIDEGFDFIALDKPHPDPFDLEYTLNTLHKLSTQHPALDTWLVVDGYHFDSAYQKSIKEAGHKLLWIDDYGHADHYYADLILNQNISADESFYANREPYTRLLLGTSYALLRREFKQWQGWKREIPATARKVLVTLGGGDPDNVTLKIIQALKQVNISGLEAKIVAGPANPNLQILSQKIGDNSNLQIITNAANMTDLMAWADVAVSAGGSTCWEMALLGLPNIIMYFAENQRPIAEKLHEGNAALNLGWSQDLSIERITQHMEQLLLSRECRREYSKNSQYLVDGSGSLRLCQEIK